MKMLEHVDPHHIVHGLVPMLSEFDRKCCSAASQLLKRTLCASGFAFSYETNTKL